MAGGKNQFYITLLINASQFGIFTTRPVQTSTLETIETANKPIASLEQSLLDFLIPAYHDTYIDLHIQLYISGKSTKAEGMDMDDKDHTCVVNNLLHSLF
jgi:hypothetical protein